MFDFQNQPVDVQLVYSEALKHGRIAGGKAYGSWSKNRMAAFILYNYGIELVEIPEAEFLPNKKGNDIRLAVDCIEIALHNKVIDTFFLVTGDADFTALVYKLKSYGKRVIALARMKSTSYELVSAVDLFIPYEDIVKSEKLTDPIDRLSEELEIFLKRSGKEFTVENISRFLHAFNVNPNKYGCETMNELVDTIYERKVERPEKIKDLKLLLIKEAIFGMLSEENLPVLSKAHHVSLSDLKTALEILVHDGILEKQDNTYNVVRNKAFFSTILEKYPVEYTSLLSFIEKVYRAFVNGRVKSLNQVQQNEFKLSSAEFKSYLEAIKRSGCLKGIDDSDYISYSTPAKIVCELEDLKVCTFSYFVKRVLSHTFIFRDELDYIKELVFSNDQALFDACIEHLIKSEEITELGNVYFYTPK
ncbi:NYN domain-containing protein [Fervidobacterium thailandense]|uniref:NYN domain-containing protein n=2 Tax=Fervidobacterium thailandense TaxID=1008305 RepID=A0A1E3G5P2_9BACT|nr:NYN domain-containing protein [Fervidobacterium thailandense]